MGFVNPRDSFSRDGQSANEERPQPFDRPQQVERPTTLAIPRTAANEVFNTFRLPTTTRNDQRNVPNRPNSLVRRVCIVAPQPQRTLCGVSVTNVRMASTSRTRKTISRHIHDVPYCPSTGYLIDPPTVNIENNVYTRHFLLAYKTLPDAVIRKSSRNPVDPSSIICKCSFCGPDKRPVPALKKSIVACAQPLPGVPVQSSNKRWRPLPQKQYLYWSSRPSSCVFRLKWMARAERPAARTDYYEVYFYREIPDKTYAITPWEFLKSVRRRKLNVGNFRHGGLYHFAVRCVDIHGRRGEFSDPSSLFLTVN